MTTDPGAPLNDGYVGIETVFSRLSKFNAMSLVVQQILAGIATAIPVIVKGVNSDAITVDVQAMVNQVTGDGIAIPHGLIYKVPFYRLQGGNNGIVCDPVIGDMGDCVIQMRDITSMKRNRAISNPGSERCFDMADAMYYGGFLNPLPGCRLAFVDGGMTLTPDDGVTFITIKPGEIILKAAKITTHATEQNAWDAGGTGFVYQAEQIDTYTDGVPSTGHAPTPPEVPT